MAMKLPDVLSIQRGFIITDGVMSSIVDQDGAEMTKPIRVIRHGIRGTGTKEEKKSVSNLQRTESAKTSADAIGLQVDFSIKTIQADKLVYACSKPEYRTILNGFIDRFINNGSDELTEVCRRYARNMLNGRWLWRNRVLGDVSVTATVGTETFSGNGSRLNDFDDYTMDEQRLAEYIIAGLRGDGSRAINVCGRVYFGFKGEVEVFPSQNMVTDKPKGFARSLYKIDMIPYRSLFSIISSSKKNGDDAGEYAADMIDMGRAALRDQKIGNAIRTIDTWYEGYAPGGMIIPIEPNGASLERNEFLRKGRQEAKHVFSVIDEMQPSEVFNENAAYAIGVLVRGGVLSQKND